MEGRVREHCCVRIFPMQRWNTFLRRKKKSYIRDKNHKVSPLRSLFQSLNSIYIPVDYTPDPIRAIDDTFT